MDLYRSDFEMFAIAKYDADTEDVDVVTEKSPFGLEVLELHAYAMGHPLESVEEYDPRTAQHERMKVIDIPLVEFGDVLVERVSALEDRLALLGIVDGELRGNEAEALSSLRPAQPDRI